MNEMDEKLVDELQADWDALPLEIKEAIKRLSAARCRAHNVFDPIWQSGEMTRSEAYRWLAERMGLSRSKCHMERMDEAQCDRVVDICLRRDFEGLSG